MSVSDHQILNVLEPLEACHPTYAGVMPLANLTHASIKATCVCAMSKG